MVTVPFEPRGPDREVTPDTYVVVPRRQRVHGHTRTAQEGLSGIVGSDYGAKSPSAPELQLVLRNVVVVHGKHSATVESVLAQRPSLVKTVPVEKAGLVERGNRQRAWLSLIHI